MPLSRLAADVFGVVTVILVCILTLFGLFCIGYSHYFRSRVRLQGFLSLGYFNGPWLIRTALISVTIWWGFSEVSRLTFFRESGRLLHCLTTEWQEHICKFYVLSNLGFAEPSLFIIIGHLLHASLQRREAGPLSPLWNIKIVTYVFVSCFPVFIAQLVLVLIGSKLYSKKRDIKVLPKYFAASITFFTENQTRIVICTYPLLNTILHGFITVVIVVCFAYFGVQMLWRVINQGLKQRIYILITSVLCLLPLRVLFLGLSVLPHPSSLLFEILVFLAFLVLSTCAVLGIYLLVYCPVADSLAVKYLGGMGTGNYSLCGLCIETDGHVANQSLREGTPIIAGSSGASMRGNCISSLSLTKDDNPPGGI